MKKRIFALALALCMMVSVMPNSFAAGILSVGDGTDSSAPTTTSGGGILSVTGSTPTQLSNTGSTQQTGILSNTNSTQPLDDGTGETGNEAPEDKPLIVETQTYSGTSETTITGQGDTAAPTTRKDVDGLFTSKTVSKKNDSTYTVRLEAYTDGTSGTYTSAVPADIVLVLEESSWMSTTMYEYIETDTLDTNETYYIKNGDSYSAIRYCNSTIEFGIFGRCQGWYTGFHLRWLIFDFHWGERINVNSTQVYRRQALTTTKIEALATAATAFVDKVVEDANTNNVDHRVAIVSYSSSAAIDVGLESDIRKNKSQVYEAIEGLTAAEATGSNLALGLDQAQAAFDGAVATTGTRNKVVVVYSYGVAGSSTKTDADGNLVPSWNNAGVDIANTAINTAKTMKTTDKIAIYTVGLGDDVDPSLNILDSDVNKAEDIYRTNAYLHFVSSNFPNATNIETAGTNGSINNGKYISALDISSLNSIFEKLENEFETPNISLDANTEIQDSVSKYFSIDTTTVKVYTANHYSGTFVARENWDDVTDDDDMTVSKSATAVAVKGFNYNSHFVGGSAPQKLIVEFDITVKSGFMGGNNVPTNNSTAGVYVASALIENFTYPLVNVDIPDPELKVADDQVIYYGEDAPEVSSLYTKIDTTVDSWKYDFVELTCTTPDGIGNKACKTDYKFQLDIGPVAAATTDIGDANSMDVKSDTKFVAVHVLEAVLKAKDDTIYLGQKTNLNELVSHSWACSCAEDTVTRADSASAPEVDYVFAGVTSSVENAYAPADNDCEDLAVTCSHGDDADELTVHVVEPVAEFQDSTIYLGYTPVQTDDQNDFETYNIKGETTWVHTKEDGTAQASGEKPLVTYGFATTSDYTDCATVTATVYSDGVANSQTDETFMVHVLRPSLDVTDGYIYQGQTKPLTECVTLSDDWADPNGDRAEEDTIIGTPFEKSEFAFKFDKGEDGVFGPMSCEGVVVTEAAINGKKVLNYFAKKNFTVHVLKPVFAVITNDLWADCGTPVDLYNAGDNDAVSGITYGWAYTGNCDHPTELPAGAPTITVNKVLFDKDSHTMTAADATAVVNSLTYTNDKIADQQSATVASGDVAVTYPENATCVTLHVNKFDLTINKVWDGNAIYKQDAIFTVAHGQDTFKVVLPKGESSVTVTGLLCGQDYSVTEDDAWTWRWEAEKTVEFATHEHDVSTSAPTQPDNTSVSFTNSLIEKLGELWLSFCTTVKNIFAAVTTTEGGSF